MGQGSSPTAQGEGTTCHVGGWGDKLLLVHRKPRDGKCELEAVEGGMPWEDRKAAGEYYDQIVCWEKCFGGDRFVFVDLYELERRNSMRSQAVSLLNLDNGRRDNLREDYEAEMDCISIF